MNAHPLLSVEHAQKRFGGLIAVDDVSFSVKQGELIGLIGPNGSGKTTMLNLVSGLLKPSAGRIRFAGEEITGLPAYRIARRGIARTFQLVRPLASLSAVENVIAGAAFGHVRVWGPDAYREAEILLGRVGLAGRGNAHSGSMTYIDQKRLELARALAGNPRLLLLDEWLAGLNPTELRIGIDLIAGLREDGRTIVMVEHVMDAIRALCDRCIVMSGGSKIADGSAHDVLTQPEVISAYLGSEDA